MTRSLLGEEASKEVDLLYKSIMMMLRTVNQMKAF